jgi:universal stress protein A
MIPIRRILVPVDFSVPSDAAMRYGWTLAEQFGAAVDVLHVVGHAYLAAPGAEMYLPPPTAYLEDIDRQAREQLDALVAPEIRERFHVRLLLRHGDPYHEIVRHAADEGVDLIIMGTHGRGGLAHMLIGSVAEKVVRKAPCAVLTVHGIGPREEPLLQAAGRGLQTTGVA